MCHVLVTAFPPLYRSLSKRLPVGRVREHHTLPTRLSSKSQSFIRQGGCATVTQVFFVAKDINASLCGGNTESLGEKFSCFKS